MAQTFVFHVSTPPRRRATPDRPPRHISSKLQEIALRSPKDLAAFDVLADVVLARLNDAEKNRPH